MIIDTKYKYAMIDIDSLKSIALSTYKSRVEPWEYEKLQVIARKKLVHYQPDNGVAQSANELIDKIFREILPKYEFSVREKQIKLSKDMCRALMSNSTSISESPVGNGKTYAYLVAAIVVFIIRKKIWKGEAFIISTSSIDLQEALKKHYIPKISNILVKEGILNNSVDSVVRKGKENFLCEKRFLALQNDIYFNEYIEDVEELNINVDLMKMDPISASIKDKICVKDCNRDCLHYKSCRYLKYLEDAPKGDYLFQICNHHYFIAIQKEIKPGKLIMPEFAGVIFDEAHNILIAARQIYGGELYDNEIDSFICQYINTNFFSIKGLKRGLKDLVDRVRGYNNKLFNIIEKNVSKELIPLENGLVIETARYFSDINECFNKIINLYEQDKSSEANKIIYAIRRFQDRVNCFSRFEKNIIWFEKEDCNQKIVYCPKNLSYMLKQEIWRLEIPYIFTSGTLAVRGKFSYFQGSNGIQNQGKAFEGLVFSSDFSYEKNMLLYLPEAVPPYSRDDKSSFIDCVVRHIKQLIEATNGHTMVLFSAYETLERVAGMFGTQINGIPVIKSMKSDKRTIDKFRTINNAILFATGAAWEGIDLPGDVLSSLIIIKLPFEAPNPINYYERSLYDTDQSFKENSIIPNMILKLKQGAGRLIRNESDTGVLSILDGRVDIRGRYRDIVVDSLPECRVSSNIEDVKNFILKVKDKSYFE